MPSPKQILKYLAIICIMAGCALRFHNLSAMGIWDDEADSILHASGHSVQETLALYKNNPQQIAQNLLKLQTLDNDHGALDVFKNFEAEDPQHMPLYYMMTHEWMRVFGESTLALRALPAMLSLLLIPLSYLLALTLFRDRNAAWLAALFSSVSPFEFVYAREIREYVLFLVFVTASTYFFSASKWKLYFVAMTLGVWTCALSFGVMLGHLIATAFAPKKFKPLVLSSAATLILTAPWLIHAVQHSGQSWQIEYWKNDIPSVETYARGIAANFYRVFVDFNIGGMSPNALPFAALAIAVLAVEAYSVIKTIRHREYAALYCILAITLLMTVGQDLIFSGKRGLVSRYQLAGYLALQLITVGALAKQTSRRISVGIVCFLTFCGLTSITIYTESPTWLSKNLNANYVALGNSVSSHLNVTVVADNPGSLLAIAHYVPAKTALVYFPPLPEISNKNCIYLNAYDPEKMKQAHAMLNRRFAKIAWPFESSCD